MGVQGRLARGEVAEVWATLTRRMYSINSFERTRATGSDSSNSFEPYSNLPARASLGIPRVLSPPPLCPLPPPQ